MKNKVASIYVTFFGTIISIALIVVSFVFVSGEFKDVLLNLGFALFSASFITFIISIFEYRNIKSDLTLKFCYECEDFIKLLYSIEYVNIGAHEIAVSKYMQLEPLAESDTEEGELFFKSILLEDTEWHSNDLKSYKMELRLYKPSFDQKIRQSMQSYLKIGTFNIRTAEMILNDIHFMLKKKNKRFYEQALAIIEDSLNRIEKHKEFFECYLSNRIGQHSQVVDRLAKVNAFFFEIKKNGAFTTADEKISLELKNAVDLINKNIKQNNKSGKR